jgi:hypothetical protein
MIISKAYETLLNPKSRAEHDFMIDYRNVMEIANELNNQTSNFNESYQPKVDKRYHRTNHGYQPKYSNPLNYSDKPHWTIIGNITSYLGIIMFIFIVCSTYFTEPIKSRYISYKSRIGRITTEDKKFFGIISDHEMGELYTLESKNKSIYITRNQSILANFSSDANIEVLNIEIITIGRFALIFCLISCCISIATIIIKKNNYYFFIELSTLNAVLIFFQILMIL